MEIARLSCQTRGEEHTSKWEIFRALLMADEERKDWATNHFQIEYLPPHTLSIGPPS